MYVGLIARRYATALYAFATANAEADRTCEEVRRLTVRYREHPSVRTVLFSPVLHADEKLEAMRRLYGGRMCGSLERFIRLVIDHHRERYLHFMFNSFIGIYEYHHNIREATLATAVPMSDEVVQRLADAARKKTRSEIRIQQEVHPELLGGYILLMEFHRVDASVASQLRGVKKQFIDKNRRIV